MIRFITVTYEGWRPGSGVRNLSFHVGRGEMAFFVGPSGAGKSLIRKMCAVELEPEQGKVVVGGFDTIGLREKDLRRLRRNTGLISKDFPLLNDRTVLENVILPLELQGWSWGRATRRGMKSLERFDALELGNSYPQDLSDGEYAVIALARAVVCRPPLILMDAAIESTSEEDATHFLRILAEMSDKGTTVLVFVRRVAASQAVGKKVIVLGEGKIIGVETGLPPEQSSTSSSLVDLLLKSGK